MTRSDAPGCRDAALATALLLGLGIAFTFSGISLINDAGCEGSCELIGLTLLYAGGPIGAAIGVFTDSVVIAWTLDIALWVVLGFWAARVGSRGGSTWKFTLTVLGLALVYGLALSQLVTLA